MEIAVLGGYGVGKTMYLERYPEPGETITGGVYREGPGGKASNQAIQIRRLGVAANLITAVGTDSGAAVGRCQHGRGGRPRRTNHGGFHLRGQQR